MSVNKEDTLKQFCDVTGADEARSRFFLDSSNWQLEVALSSFYEHGGSADEASAPRAAPAPITLSDSDMESPPGSPTQRKDKKKPTANTRFATLDTLQQLESSSDEDEELKKKLRLRKYFCDNTASSCRRRNPPKKEDKEKAKKEIAEEIERLKRKIERLNEERNELKSELAALKSEGCSGQAFYAGGSERSGQQILGPPGKSRKDIVTEMFKSVRELVTHMSPNMGKKIWRLLMKDTAINREKYYTTKNILFDKLSKVKKNIFVLRGAVVFEDEPSTAGRGRGAFSGVGYRLGQTPDDHETVATGGSQQAGAEGQARSVRLRLYREGFTVDDGAIRHYTDPENAEFLTCIRRGEIPPELSGGAGEVRVSLEDRRHEACARAARSHAFSGQGHMLGSPTPPTVGATAPVAAAAADRAANQRAAQEALAVDDSKPVTTIQIRLADGSRLVGRFNHSHTVGDLQQYVSRAEPSYQLLQFILLSSFPSIQLTDPTVTLKDANLLNSTVLQRLK